MGRFFRDESLRYLRRKTRRFPASGETYEPNVICYAESKDGIHWKKSPLTPIFVKGQDFYDKDRVGGCEVHQPDDGTYAMFYIGYENIDTARGCVAFSPDGVTNWKRSSENPIVLFLKPRMGARMKQLRCASL